MSETLYKKRIFKLCTFLCHISFIYNVYLENRSFYWYIWLALNLICFRDNYQHFFHNLEFLDYHPGWIYDLPLSLSPTLSLSLTHTHTHTYTYTLTYNLYMGKYVCYNITRHIRLSQYISVDKYK